MWGSLVSRRVRLLVSAAVLVAAVGPLVNSGGPLGAAETQLSVPEEGWWYALSERPTRDTPLGALVPVPGTPTPDVPEGAMPVGARLGQIDKVAAVSVDLGASILGGSVTTATLTLKQVDEEQAHLNVDQAVIVACPITGIFVPATKGELDQAPEADCEVAKAEGTRNDDGTWTFDVASIVTAWLDGTVPPNGIRFDPAGDSGATFQISFTGVEDATLTADIEPAVGGGGDPFDTGGAPTADLGGGSSDFSSGGGDFSAPVTDVPDQPAAPTTPSGGGEADPTPQVAAPAASRAGDTVGNWPIGVFIAAIAAVLLAVFAGWAMGQSEPVEVVARRQRGVARALATRTSTRST